MIAGCYSLHLYCKHEHLPIHYSQDGPIVPAGHHRYNEFPHQYAAETGGECRKAARRDGWRLVDGDAICPRCAKTKVSA